jgi:3-oxoacyl-[acyl-carrier-protein] synthase II
VSTARRVVVTGMGVVTALGRTPGELFRALVARRSAVAPIRRFDASAFPTRIAAEVACDGDEAAHDLRVREFALRAARSAIADAGGWPDADPQRLGVAIACGLGGYTHREVFAAAGPASLDGGFDAARFSAAFREAARPRTLERLSSGFLAAEIAGELGVEGRVLATDAACAAGAQALACAARWIRSGAADRVLAGAADSQIYPLGLASFCLLRALSRRNEEPARASRPFDTDRDGFVLGEGAGMLVLEERGHALRRGAEIHGELLGFGAASDGYRATDPHPEGRGAVLSLRRALADAGLAPERVAHVNAHGTSTVANDRIETRALREVFGDAASRLAITSTKSSLGHLTEASGAVEAIVTILALRERVSPPTLNLERPDPECDLDYTPLEPRSFRGDAALSSSFGFGGQCVALLFGRA